MSAETPPSLPEPPSFPSEIQKASIKFITTEALNAFGNWPGWGASGFGAYTKSFWKEMVVDGLALAVRAIVETSGVIGELQGEVEQKHEGTLLRAAAFGVNDLFGTNVQPGELKGGGPATGGSGAAHKIADVIFEGLFAALKHPQSPTPADGLENAKRMLQFNVSTALEGWLMGVLGSGVMAKWFPNWADLDDVMADTLGLGRINRRILAPVLDTLVVDPLERYFAQNFLGVLPTKEELSSLLVAGAIAEGQYFELMAQHGYKREWAAVLRKDTSKKLTESDIQLAFDVGQFTPQAALDHLKTLGYAPELAQLKLKLYELERVKAVNTQFVSTALDMFRDREIDSGRFASLARAAGASPAVVEAFQGLGQLQRARPHDIDRGTIERAYRDGLIQLGRLHAFYVYEGYSFEDQFLLEAIQIQARLAAEKKRETAPPPEEPTEGPPLPRGVAEDLHRRGLISSDELRTAYAALGFTGARIDLLMRLADARRAEQLAKEAKEKEPAPPQPPPRSIMEDAFVRGIIGEDRLRATYVALGFSAEAIAAALEVERQRKQERLDAIEARTKAAAGATAAAPRPVPQGVIEDLHRRGLVTDDRLRTYYVAFPYNADAVEQLMRRAAVRRAEYQRAVALNEAPPEPTAVSRGTEEDAFERDIIDAFALAAYYQARGYSADDIDLLMELAITRKEERETQLAKRAATFAAQETRPTA